VPNYDLPNAAPEPLRLVQLFVNTIDREHMREWLPTPAELAAWYREHGLEPGRPRAADLEQAVALREAFRALLRANNRGPAAAGAYEVVNEVARDHVTAEVRDGKVALVGRRALGQITAVALGAMLDGSWPRLKVCRNCEWSFYDYSKNRAASWCSMQLCGNRLKTRAYRRRRAQPA